jgi:hypothetical protein
MLKFYHMYCLCLDPLPRQWYMQNMLIRQCGVRDLHRAQHVLEMSGGVLPNREFFNKLHLPILQQQLAKLPLMLADGMESLMHTMLGWILSWLQCILARLPSLLYHEAKLCIMYRGLGPRKYGKLLYEM